MPELPDITVYIEALEARLQNATLHQLVISHPFVLRTVTPAVTDFTNTKLRSIERIGKCVAFGFDNDHWLVIHLMIAGRFQWVDSNAKLPARKALAQLHFDRGRVLLTEAGSKRRASIRLFASKADTAIVNRGGLEVLEISTAQFAERLTLRNHTLKRALTDPALFSGIGNAYSDEILHRARLSPVRQTQKMSTTEIQTLHDSCCHILDYWLALLRKKHTEKFPARVTAFKNGMSVHGCFQQPCPVCNTAIQRIRYVSNETNYCPRCQTDGKLLADRSLSRLLKTDWPKTIEELENTQPNGAKKL